MTEKKRKIVGNSLVFLALILAALIYCRPLQLSALGGWEDGGAEENAYVTYTVWHQEERQLEGDQYQVSRYGATGAEREAWDDLLASIRVCRMPLNWLGNLHPGTGGHQLTDGMTDWNMHVFVQDERGRSVSLQYLGDGRFLYSTTKLGQYLPCFVPNGEEICTKIDALIAQYGEKISVIAS